jgi:hypothetical protein
MNDPAAVLLNRYEAGTIGDVEFLREMRELGWSLPAATQVMIQMKHDRNPVNARPTSGRVVHVNDNVPGAVYIGRAAPRRRLKASKFANPYKVEDWGRSEAIANYRSRSGLFLQPGWIEDLIALRGKPLACWCRHDGEPKTAANACHGDVLLELLEKYSDDELRAMARDKGTGS